MDLAADRRRRKGRVDVFADIHEPEAIGAEQADAVFRRERAQARLLGAGFDGYLVKPINVREFPAQVQRYCERGRRED